jgi:hypothetical protein
LWCQDKQESKEVLIRSAYLTLHLLGPNNLHMASAHQGKVAMPILVSHLGQYLYLSDMHFGVAPKMASKNTCSKEIGHYTQNMITILGSIVNMIG